MRRMGYLGLVAGLLLSTTAAAEVAVGVRAGTLGLGLDLNVGLTEKLNLRLGYAALDYDQEVEETDLNYDGDLQLRNASALLDWHPFGGGFRLSFGAVGGGTKVDVVATPNENGTYEIDGETFTASEVGSIRGELEMGNSVSPYVGFGFGNTVDKEDRVTILFDLGAVYAGEPDVQLTATCGVAAPAPVCADLQDAVAAEQLELEEEATLYKWWPVISLGLSVRF